MDILFYMIYRGEIGTRGTHIFEVLNNLSSTGHSIRYINGKIYSPIPIKELGLESTGNGQQSIWGQIKKFMATTPLRGEALVLWRFLNEIRLFFSALRTVLRHRPDVIYRRHTTFNSDYLIARLFNIPSVKEVNGIGPDEIKITKRADSITLWVINWIERFTMPKADKVIVVASGLKEVLQKEYKVPGDKIVVIQNGANTDLFKPTNVIIARETLGLTQDVNYICFVGSLAKWQGVEYLIQSLPLIIDRCPEARLLIVGDGPIKQELFELAEKTGILNKMIFTGMVPYQEIPLYMNASDVCTSLKAVLRSGYSPLKLYEYLACGKPVVASRVSGFEIVEDSGGGILVEPGDTAATAAAIIKLLENPKLRKQMGENGSRYVVEYQSWKSVAERVAGVCQNLVNSSRDGGTR